MWPKWRWASLLVCVAVAAAQDPARRAIVGRVVDDAGAPVDGVSIVAVGMQTGLVEFGADDVVTATSDARGRFQFKALPGLPYCAFAAKALPDGGGLASQLSSWFGVGAVLELEVAKRSPEFSLPMQLTGLEAWAERGPLRCFARGSMGDSYLPSPYAIDWQAPIAGPARWPSIPSGLLQVQDGAGHWIWSAAAPAPNRAQFELPPPREVHFAVVDDAGTPIADAEILVRSGTWHDGGVDGIATQRLPVQHAVARTDADGKAALWLPHAGRASDWPAHLFVARANGCTESVSGGRGNDRYENDERIERSDDGTVRFRLVRSPLRTGRIQGLPVSREPWSAVLRVTAKLRAGTSGFLHDVRAYAAPLGDDGSYSIAHCPADVHDEQWLLRRGPGRPPLLFAPQATKGGIEAVSATTASRLAITAFDASSGPVGGRVVYLVRIDEPARGYAARIRVLLDSAGRATIDLAPGKWRVQCLDPIGSAMAEVDATKRSETSVELRLVPFATATGTVVGADGKPVAGVRFAVRASSAGGDDPLLSEWGDRGVRRVVAKCCSAEDGTFAVPLPMFSQQRLVLRAELGELRSADFEPVADPGEPLRVVLK